VGEKKKRGSSARGRSCRRSRSLLDRRAIVLSFALFRADSLNQRRHAVGRGKKEKKEKKEKAPRREKECQSRGQAVFCMLLLICHSILCATKDRIDNCVGEGKEKKKRGGERG